MLIIPKNLILIGYQQSEENPNQYIRGEEMWDFKPSLAGFINRVINSDRTKVESEEATKAYLSFKERTEAEIREKLGI